jgi:hypothetical protein
MGFVGFNNTYPAARTAYLCALDEFIADQVVIIVNLYNVRNA